MSLDNIWGLPSAEKAISLSEGELLLVDWIICGASRLLPDMEPSYLITSWEHLRLRVWQAVATNAEAQSLVIDKSEASILLAMCPTTFKWGTGADVGFSLKMKLAQYLAPEMFRHDDKDETAGDTSDSATDSAPKNAGV